MNRILMTVCKCSLLYFYSIIYFNDIYLFTCNIYIVFILGDLLCMESFTDYPHGLPILLLLLLIIIIIIIIIILHL